MHMHTQKTLQMIFQLLLHSNLELLEPGLGKRIDGEYVLYPVVVMFKLRIFLYLLGHTVDRENTYTIIHTVQHRLVHDVTLMLLKEPSPLSANSSTKYHISEV